MAKKPNEITHRYRIHAETSLEDMGKVVAQLTLMGLTNVGFELIEDNISFNKKPAFETTAEEELTNYIKDNPTFAIKDAIAHFKPHGRTNSSMYTAARILCEKKVLKKLGGGNYSSMHIKAIAAPKGIKQGQHYEVMNKDLLWNAIKGRKRFTVAEMRALFASEGRPEKSVGGILFNFAQEKRIKNVGEGEYEVTKNKIKKPKTGSPNSAQNGKAPKQAAPIATPAE